MRTQDDPLAALRQSREGTLEALARLTDKQMAAPVTNPLTPGGVRALVQRMLAHEAEHTEHLARLMESLGVRPTEAQAMAVELQASRARLEGLARLLTERDLDRAPSPGEWTPRQLLEHLAQGEAMYLARIKHALVGRKQRKVDMAPRRP